MSIPLCRATHPARANDTQAHAGTRTLRSWGMALDSGETPCFVNYSAMVASPYAAPRVVQLLFHDGTVCGFVLLQAETKNGKSQPSVEQHNTP